MVGGGVGQTPHAVLVAGQHAALDARVCKDNGVNEHKKKKGKR